MLPAPPWLPAALAVVTLLLAPASPAQAPGSRKFGAFTQRLVIEPRRGHTEGQAYSNLQEDVLSLFEPDEVAPSDVATVLGVPCGPPVGKRGAICLQLTDSAWRNARSRLERLEDWEERVRRSRFEAISRTPRSDAELVQCGADADCIAVPEEVCGCNAAGRRRAINRLYARYWAQRPGKDSRQCGLAAFSTHWSCSATPVCRESRCVLEGPGKPPETPKPSQRKKK